MFSFAFRPNGNVAVYWGKDLVTVIKDKETAELMFRTALAAVVAGK